MCVGVCAYACKCVHFSVRAHVCDERRTAQQQHVNAVNRGRLSEFYFLPSLQNVPSVPSDDKDLGEEYCRAVTVLSGKGEKRGGREGGREGERGGKGIV